jgi:uncharacterized protein
VAGEKFDLTLKEALFLSNQYLIIEKVDPDNVADYALLRKAVEEGYTREYGRLVARFDDEMSRPECEEVCDSLDLYRALSAARARS